SRRQDPQARAATSTTAPARDENPTADEQLPTVPVWRQGRCARYCGRRSRRQTAPGRAAGRRPRPAAGRGPAPGPHAAPPRATPARWADCLRGRRSRWPPATSAGYRPAVGTPYGTHRATLAADRAPEWARQFVPIAPPGEPGATTPVRTQATGSAATAAWPGRTGRLQRRRPCPATARSAARG